MKRARNIMAVIAVMAAILLTPFFLLAHKKTAYYSYKEVIYRSIINDTVGKERDPGKVSFILLDYFYSNFFTPADSRVIDKDVYNDLLRDISWCDQRSWAMGTFLGKLGIDNRMVMTRNPVGSSNHTVLKVFIDNKWRMLDPYYGIAIRKDNELVSYEEICNEPYLFYLSQDMLALKAVDSGKYVATKEYFTKNIFYKNPHKPSVWSNPISKKDLKRKAVTAIIDWYIYVFGNRFSYAYQDIYLMFYAPSKEADAAYFKARNYDMLNRYKLAADSYKKVIGKFSHDPKSDDAMFFLGLLYNRNKEAGLSVYILQALLKRFPDTRWKNIAYYYLGLNYELMKSYDLAEQYYRETIEMYKALNEKGLRPTEYKTAKRLSNLMEVKNQGDKSPLIGVP